MTKILLVEDDKSLREIYGVRLLAEGYDIVSADDGEKALAMAIKERPKLIISDVMMPNISGFGMLDILRSTTETKDIKVIIMTALSSEDQRQRGAQLGANRYLVKSQVGIEDVIRVVHEVLGDQASPAPAPAGAPPPPVVQAVPAPATTRPQAVPPTPLPSRPVAPPPSAPSGGGGTPASTPPPIARPTPQPASYPAAPLQPAAAYPAAPMPAPPSAKNRIIQPLNDPNISKVNINELLDRELAKEAGIDVDKRPPVVSTEQEKSAVTNQLNQFASAPAKPVPPAGGGDNVPTIQIDTEGHVTMPGQPTPPASTPPPATPASPSPGAPTTPAAPPAPAPAPSTPPTPPPAV